MVRHVCSSVDELLADATDRRPFFTTDSKSGSEFERVTIGGEPHIVKYVHVDDDWTMRTYGDIGPRPLLVWQAGLMDLAPDLIEHGTVGVAGGLGRHGWGAAILMRDLSDAMVPPGDDAIPIEHHLRFLDHLAGVSARAWGWRDDVGLLPYGQRWYMFDDRMVDAERDLGFPAIVPKIAGDGWERFAQRAPADVRAVIDELKHDCAPLVTALRTTPSTFLHGDLKLGNMGALADGRTVLIDWSYPGEGPVCHDLTWYLALNAARLPMSKDDSIEVLRTALVRHGIDVDGWWERQVALCLLGGLVQFGWEKAFGADSEFDWWCDRARHAVSFL
ncbi:MAG: phosphotransferase [Actinomycetota bacterium]|nr:phosphotransferase [Actinomycetota bacterium]